MPTTNDLIIPHLTADGRWLGSDAITAASAVNDLAIPILTADGRQTLAKVTPCAAVDDRCIEALTADGKKTLVKFESAIPATCADFVRLNPLDMVMTLSGINGNCPGCPWPMDIDGTYSEARPPYSPGWVHSGDPSFGAFAYPYWPPYPGLAIILWFECQVSKVRVEINKYCPDLGFMATWAECQLSGVTISSGRLEFVATVKSGACTAGIATFSAAII